MPGETQVTTPDPSAGGSAEVAPEALHDSAIAAVEAWQNEADETKRGDLKTAAQKAVETAKKAVEAQKVAAAANKPPDKYELKLPENSLLGATHHEEVAALAKELKLPQAAAAKLLERDNALINKFFDTQRAEVAATQAKWAEDNLASVGGDKTKLAAMAEMSNRVVKRFDDAEGTLGKELASTGLGNNPLLLAFLNRIGQGMSDDQLVMPGGEKKEVQSTGEALFAKSLGKA